MGKKKSSMTKELIVTPSKRDRTVVAAKADKWACIESDDAAPTAKEVLYKAPVPKPPKKFHYKDSLKKKRLNDGRDAPRLDSVPVYGNGIVSSNGKALAKEKRGGKKRRADDSEASESNKRTCFQERVSNESKRSALNLLDSIYKNISTTNDVEEDYIVEEPDDSVTVHVQKNQSKKVRVERRMDNSEFDGLESDDDDMDDEEVSDEDLVDEDIEEELVDEDVEDEMSEDCIESEAMHLNPEDIETIVDDEAEEVSDVEDEEFGEDESVFDEEEGAESMDDIEDEEGDEEGNEDSDVVSEQDAESDVEGHLTGEQRKAIVLDKKSNAAGPKFATFPFQHTDSVVSATKAFQWIINSCDVQTFFRDFYQSNCLVVKRGRRDYYGDLFSTDQFVQLLGQQYVEYGRNVNIAEYTKGVRKTMNGEGRVYPHHILDHLKLGRSVQLVNPQTFNDNIWHICEVLQELFGCFVGANTYLTPAGSAGFAPHWDEIDAFLLQLEGKKYWKVYSPLDESQELPRESSGNFSDADMKGRSVAFEGWVEAGDMLYIPRGFIHQARTSKDVHSLHVTVSTGRLWSFADLMEKLVPESVKVLAEERWKTRKGLPVGLLDMSGVANMEYKLEEQFDEKFRMVLDRHMSMLRNVLADHCMESGVDLMAREFMKTALPPMLTHEEKKHSALGIALNVLSGKQMNFGMNTRVRFIRRHAQRLIYESEDRCFVVHRMNNSRLYEGRPEQLFDLPTEWAEGFGHLCSSYPDWIAVKELPSELSKHEKGAMCALLFSHGLLMAKNQKQ